MEAIQPPGELFSRAYVRFYHSLKKRYSLGIERAKDKTYAETYYRQSLFNENPLIPRYSVLYHSLVSTYLHFQKLGDSDPLKQTFGHLSEIRSLASEVVERTFLLHTQKYESPDPLHWLYIQGIEDAGKSVLELIDQEQRLVKCKEQKIVLLLALTQAIQNLLEEFTVKEGESEELVDLILPASTNRLTRSQQVLIFYYVSQLLGIKHKKNVSKSAHALHTFLGIPYTQITHSELYKKLLNPLTFSSEKATIQNLKIARSFFEDWGLASAISLIDSDIEKVKKTLE
ncbi:hypothetical protein [Fluviicola sp.]|uniref:hypothetical protein n=1 Tax=Fluviicola sp. TaxID=1917219 RepID=UPI0031CF6AA0